MTIDLRVSNNQIDYSGAGMGEKKFNTDVEKFIENLNISYSTGIRKVAIDTFEGIVRKTPVDEGRARGSWNLSTHAPDPTVLPETSKTDRDEASSEGLDAVYPPPEPLLSISDVKDRPDIYISNNLDYILPLEEGWSETQAPDGMVRLTLQEMQSHIKQILELS